MASIIKVIQQGSNKPLTIPKQSIKYYEYLQYHTGQIVTHITFMDNTTIDVLESVESIDEQFS